MIQMFLYLGMAVIAIIFFATINAARRNRLKKHKILAWTTVSMLVTFVAAVDTAARQNGRQIDYTDGLFIVHLTHSLLLLACLITQLVQTGNSSRPSRHRWLGYASAVLMIETLFTGAFLIARL